MAKRLVKKLGLLEVFCIATGAMISSGLFILPGLAFDLAGPAIIISYFIAGLACIPTVLSMAELTSAMPKAGGDYFYITRGFGPFVGTVAGMGSWFALSLKSAWALIGMGAYLSIITPFPIQWIAVAVCLFFIILNIIGVEEAGRFQVFLVVGLLAILAVYIGWGGLSVDFSRLSPFFSKGHVAMFGGVGFVFIAYGGLTQIVAMAEEIRNPQRNLLLGMVLSLLVTILLYVLVVLVTVGVTDPEILKGTLLPISEGAESFAPSFFQKIVAVGAFLAFISTGNAGIMSAARYLLGMSRDGHLPKSFQKISPKFGTPYISVLFTGLVIMFSLIVLRLELLVKIGSAVLLTLYIFANATVILFRQSRILSYRPSYRSPLYPYMHIAGILVGIFILLEVETGVLFLTMLFFLAGALFYRYTAHKRVVRDSALSHVLNQLISEDKELTTDDVYTELKNIVIEREDNEIDGEEKFYQNLKTERFEKAINNAEILDMDYPANDEHLFRKVAGIVSKTSKASKDDLFKRFVEREKKASTLIDKGIAIPHLVIGGKNLLKIVIARSKKGFNFSGGKTIKLAVFVVSSFDQRNTHLRILAYFVNMVEDPVFQTEWLMEMDSEELKYNINNFINRKKAVPPAGPQEELK